MPLPDEGLIHAWLDGQLPPDEAARVEQLVARDAAWAAAAADARGLIAASSRILSALDYVPAGIVPKGTATPVARRLPWWTKAAAAVVLVAGASTLVMRRAPEPEIVRVTQAAKPADVAIAPSASTVAPERTPPPATKETPLSRRRTAGAAVAAASGVVPNTPAPLPALALPTPNLAAQSGAVAEQQAKVAVVTEQAPRQQMMDQARQGAAQVLVQRTSTDPGVAKAFVARDAAPAPAQKIAGGIAREERALSTARPGACYRLRDSRTLAEVGTIMRVGRIDGDTLRLESVRTPSPLRAWVVSQDSVARGVLTTEPDRRGMVLVTASPAACPAP